VFRWNNRALRVVIALGAFAALAISSGADWRWF
jgi:hypothetical protein